MDQPLVVIRRIDTLKAWPVQEMKSTTTYYVTIKYYPALRFQYFLDDPPKFMLTVTNTENSFHDKLKH